MRDRKRGGVAPSYRGGGQNEEGNTIMEGEASDMELPLERERGKGGKEEHQ